MGKPNKVSLKMYESCFSFSLIPRCFVLKVVNGSPKHTLYSGLKVYNTNDINYQSLLDFHKFYILK